MSNIGKISYCEINLGGTPIIDSAGFRSFDLGSPSGSNTSVSGSKGTYAVVDDIETSVYRDASITVLEGSYMQQVLTDLFETDNYGSEVSFVLTKNVNNGAGLLNDKMVAKLRCIKTPGVRTGYAITGNGDETALVTFTMELQELSEILV